MYLSKETVVAKGLKSILKKSTSFIRFMYWDFFKKKIMKTALSKINSAYRFFLSLMILLRVSVSKVYFW